MPTYQVYMPDKVYNELIDIANAQGESMKDLMQRIIGNFITEQRSTPPTGKKA